jgi:hypothetical protein
MSAPLNKKQKAYLSQLARRAFNLEVARARGAGEVLAANHQAEGEPLDALLRDEAHYRHAHVAFACGKLGLRCCSQDDYRAIEAHFLNILGEVKKAFNSFVLSATEKTRVAKYMVVQACKEFDFQIGYAEHICREQNNGASLDDVDPKTLWRIIFTIRTRGAARNRKKALPVNTTTTKPVKITKHESQLQISI